MLTYLTFAGRRVFLSLKVSRSLNDSNDAGPDEYRRIIRQTWHAKECVRAQKELLHCQIKFKGQFLKSSELKP